MIIESNKTNFFMKHTSLLCGMIVFLCSFLPQLFFATKNTPFSMVYDEFSTLAAAGLTYPLNWTEALASGNRYYGGGFSFLFGLFFHLFKDPMTIYYWILVVLTLVESLGAVVAYILMRRHFTDVALWKTILIALFSNYIVSKRSNEILNEPILYLIVWLIVLLLFELHDSQSGSARKRVLSSILAVVSAYSLTAHERMLILLPMFAVVWFFVWILLKKKLFSIVFFTVTYIPCWWLARSFKSIIVNMNFPNAANTVQNTELSVSGLSLLGSLKYWGPYLLSILGQVVTITLASSCIVLLAFALCGHFGFQTVFNRSTFSSHLSQKQPEQKICLGIVFLTAGIIAVMLYQSLGFLQELSYAIADGYDSNRDALKIFTYTRYFGIFVPPLCMLTLLYFQTAEREKTRRWLWIVGLIGIALTVVWITVIYPYVRFSKLANERWYAFDFWSGFDSKTGYNCFLWGAIALFVLIPGIYTLIRFRKYKILLCFLAAFSIWQYGYTAMKYDTMKSSSMKPAISTYYELEKAGVSDLVNDLYVQQAYKTVYQFLYYDEICHIGLPDYDAEQGLVITSAFSSFKDSLEHGWYAVDMKEDQSQYVFVKGEELCYNLENSGLHLSDFTPVSFELDIEDFTKTKTSLKASASRSYSIGTYVATLNDPLTAGEELTLTIVNTANSHTVVKQVFEGDHVTFSVPIAFRGKIILTGSGAKSGSFHSVSIRKTNKNAVVGLNSTDSSTAIKQLLTNEAYNSIALFSNLSDPKLDTQSLSESLGKNICVRNESEILSDNFDYVICFTDSDWLYLLNRYTAVYVDDAFVLLKSAALEGGSLVNTNIDKAITKRLSEGMYTLVSTPSDASLYHEGEKGIMAEIYEGNDQDPCLVIPVECIDNAFVFQMPVNGVLKNWKSRIIDSNGVEIPVQETQIKKTVSLIQKQCDNMTEALGSFSKEYLTKASIVISLEDTSTSKELMQKYVLEGTFSDYDITFRDIPGVEDLPEDCIIICPDSIFLVFSSVQKGFDLLLCDDNLDLLYRNGSEVSPMVDGKLSQNGWILKEYFLSRSEAEEEFTLELPAGSYELLFDKRSSALQGWALYLDGKKLRDIDQNSITEESNRTIISIDSVGMKKLSICDSEGKSVLSHLYGIRKSNTLKSALVQGEVEHDSEGTISGTGTVHIETIGMNVYRNKEYTVTIHFTGDPKEATLKFIDGMYNSSAYTKENNEIEKLDDGHYMIQLTVKPGTARKKDVIVFDASFNGRFEVTSLEISAD